MAYFVDVFKPENYAGFLKSSQTLTGFSDSLESRTNRVQPGDFMVCYVTQISRWFGLLRVESKVFNGEGPLFESGEDGGPFPRRFHVTPLVVLGPEHAVPMYDQAVWDQLEYTRDQEPGSKGWTGLVRQSLSRLSDHDGEHLHQLLTAQADEGATLYPLDRASRNALISARVPMGDSGTPPMKSTPETAAPAVEDVDDAPKVKPPRESIRIQGLLAQIGATMGHRIWIPKNDRGAVSKVWDDASGALLEDLLPLSYHHEAAKKVEQIDVLWIKGTEIIRAFEIEHTTAIYSGLLRMADLMSMLPNTRIEAHIVAPESRKAKVLAEIRRPAFNQRPGKGLIERCSFLGYGDVEKIANLEHLDRMQLEVMNDYAERAYQ